MRAIYPENRRINSVKILTLLLKINVIEKPEDTHKMPLLIAQDNQTNC